MSRSTRGDMHERATGSLSDAPTRSVAGDPSRFELPARVGPFVPGGLLGRGAMGVVARARDTRDGSEVALKFLAADPRRSGDEILRVEREARLLAVLRHPGVALVQGVEEHEGLPVLVLELVPGETLAERLARGPLPLPEALAVARGIAAAVEAAHAHGIVHRDLKPGNVKLVPEGGVKVLDFGIACRAASDAPRSLASEAWDADPGGIAGTPGYMAPEQVEGEGASPRADTWALGCLVYECLAGAPAFGGRTIAERVRATREASPDLSRLPPETPDAVLRLLRACLAREPSQRPASAEVVRRALDAVLGGAREEPGPAVAEPASARPALPRPRSAFVGRAPELDALRRELSAPGLVTLTGAGGSGKTRLALEAALSIQADPPSARFGDGAAFVELALVADAEGLLPAISAALGLGALDPRSPEEDLAARLAPLDLLLVLDNCEHLREAASALAGTLMAAAPRLSLLATSHVPLRPGGERVVPVALFVERARAARFGFRLDASTAPFVARCCRSLDGVPLAIELAAARLRAVTPERLADELERGLAGLHGGSAAALPRHQALLRTMDWSHSLLDERERVLYRRLGAFAGPFTLALAEEACADGRLPRERVAEALAGLEEKSLVAAAPGQGAAHWRLLAPVREHASERLAESGEGDAVLGRLLDALLALGREAERRLEGAEQSACSAELRAIHATLAGALRSAAGIGRADDAVQFMVDTGMYWVSRALSREAIALLDLLDEGGLRGPHARGWAHLLRGHHSMLPGDHDRAWRHLERAERIFAESGEEGAQAEALNGMSQVAWLRWDLAESRRLGELSTEMRRRLGLHDTVANSLNQLGLIARSSGDLPGARGYHEESVALLRETGNPHLLATALGNLGVVLLEMEEHGAACERFAEAADLARANGSVRAEMFAEANLGVAHLRAQRVDEALPRLAAAAALAERMADRPGAMTIVLASAHAWRSRGELERAARLQGASLALRDSIGAKRFLHEARWESLNDALREALGSGRFDEEFERGRALPLEAALRLVGP